MRELQLTVTMDTRDASRPFTHRALFYEADSELVEALVPFVREGVAADEKVVVVVRPEVGELLVRRLGTTAGFDLLDSEQLYTFPIHTLARDLDTGRVERLGTEATPDVTLGELARVAVTPPRRSEAVRIEGGFLVDAADPDAVRAELRDADEVVEPPTRGGGFYDLFLDRRGWPAHIRAGYDATRRRRSASRS